jgi:hypothetical protein
MTVTPAKILYELFIDRNKFKNKLGAYMAEAWQGQSIQTTETTYKERIFTDGKNAAGGKIGDYGDKPGFYSKKYKDYWIPVRMTFGKQVDHVDLNFEGKLKKSIVVEAAVKTAYLVTKNAFEYRKAKVQEKLQAAKKQEPPMDIFTPSDEELQKFENRLILELEKNIFFLT